MFRTGWRSRSDRTWRSCEITTRWPKNLGWNHSRPTTRGDGMTVRKKDEQDYASLLRVTVEVEGRRFVEDLGQQALITPDADSVNDALATTPGRYAVWAMLEAVARRRCDDLKRRVDTAQSDLKELEARIGVELTVDSAPKLTVDGVKFRVATDPRRLAVVKAIQTLQLELVEADDSREKLAVGRRT